MLDFMASSFEHTCETTVRCHEKFDVPLVQLSWELFVPSWRKKIVRKGGGETVAIPGIYVSSPGATLIKEATALGGRSGDLSHRPYFGLSRGTGSAAAESTKLRP
jgi:hypothetical protein